MIDAITGGAASAILNPVASAYQADRLESAISSGPILGPVSGSEPAEVSRILQTPDVLPSEPLPLGSIIDVIA